MANGNEGVVDAAGQARIVQLEALCAQMQAEGERLMQDNQNRQQENVNLRATVEGMQQQFQQVQAARADQQQTAYKYANRAPEYHHDGKKSWTVFLSERRDWMRLYNITEQELGEAWHKSLLMSMLRGTAREMVTGQEDTLQGMALQEMLRSLGEVFQPQAESELFRQDFKARKQTAAEDIIRYLSSKEAMFRRAYAEPQQHMQTLLEETIKGIYNQSVKRGMYRYLYDPARPLANYNALRRHASACVAEERAKWLAGVSESTSLDGLSATSAVNDGASLFGAGTPMEIGAMGGGQKCYHCDSPGHYAAKCPKKRSGGGQGGPQGGKFKGTCHRCHRVGHKRADCFSRKTADGKDLPPNDNKNKAKVREMKEEEGEIREIDSDQD